MRFCLKSISLLASFAFIACQPAPVRPASQQPIPSAPGARTLTPTSTAPAIATRPESPAPADTSPTDSPRISRKSIAGIEFEGVTFDSRTHRLSVVDQPRGPGSTFTDAAGVAGENSALAVLNASFFTPEGAPLGLVVSRGKSAGSWNTASALGSGIFRESSAGILSISRRSSRSAVSGSRELIQAGPLLIENGYPVSGLESSKPAVRSIILTDGRSRWWFGRTSPCTLAALGQALFSGSPASWKVRHALNLDGGRSTDLHISGGVPGGPLTRRGIMNRPVRNFVALVPR